MMVSKDGGALRGVVSSAGFPISAHVWNQPYLETCCRAALHRLNLCAQAGRPAGMMDDPCLARLAEMGLCGRGEDGRFRITRVGQERHRTEILGIAAAYPMR